MLFHEDEGEQFSDEQCSDEQYSDGWPVEHYLDEGSADDDEEFEKVEKKERRKEGKVGVIHQIRDILDSLDMEGSFAAGGSMDCQHKAPIIEVEGYGRLSLPLSAEDAARLKPLCDQAPFGKREATIVDTNVRNTLQLGTDRFSILITRSWLLTLADIMQRATSSLGITGIEVCAQLYKLLLYEPGGFFAPHQDSEKAAGHFGSLVVMLPSSYTGGELVVSHAGQQQLFGASQLGDGMAWVAFYADCTHEIKPVTSGYRLCLVYNLCAVSSTPSIQLSAPAAPACLSNLLEAVRAWNEGGDGNKGGGEQMPNRLIYMLEHRYTQANRSGLDSLKGHDRQRALLLQHVARQTGLTVLLAQVNLTWNTDKYGEWEETEKWDLSIVDVLAGSASDVAIWSGIEFSKQDLEDEMFLKRLRPDGREGGQYTGNEGAPLTRWYRHAALVLVPNSKRYDVISAGEGGITRLVHLLHSTTERLVTIQAQQHQDTGNQHKHQGKLLPQQHQHRHQQQQPQQPQQPPAKAAHDATRPQKQGPASQPSKGGTQQQQGDRQQQQGQLKPTGQPGPQPQHAPKKHSSPSEQQQDLEQELMSELQAQLQRTQQHMQKISICYDSLPDDANDVTMFLTVPRSATYDGSIVSRLLLIVARHLMKLVGTEQALQLLEAGAGCLVEGKGAQTAAWVNFLQKEVAPVAGWPWVQQLLLIAAHRAVKSGPRMCLFTSAATDLAVFSLLDLQRLAVESEPHKPADAAAAQAASAATDADGDGASDADASDAAAGHPIVTLALQKQHMQQQAPEQVEAAQAVAQKLLQEVVNAIPSTPEYDLKAEAVAATFQVLLLLGLRTELESYVEALAKRQDLETAKGGRHFLGEGPMDTAFRMAPALTAISQWLGRPQHNQQPCQAFDTLVTATIAVLQRQVDEERRWRVVEANLGCSCDKCSLLGEFLQDASRISCTLKVDAAGKGHVDAVLNAAGVHPTAVNLSHESFPNFCGPGRGFGRSSSAKLRRLGHISLTVTKKDPEPWKGSKYAEAWSLIQQLQPLIATPRPQQQQQQQNSKEKKEKLQKEKKRAAATAGAATAGDTGSRPRKQQNLEKVKP